MASKVIKHVNRMRIIAIPLTSGASSSGTNTYYHFQTAPKDKKKENPNLLKKAMGKAADLWAGFGKAPEGSWKYRTFQYGEHLMDRIEFEELALKSMDPSLGPQLTKLGKPEVEIEEKSIPSIPLLYPSLFAANTTPLTHLEDLLSKRTPTHRKGFYFWLLISPLTAPFMIIPIIPNLPFFFCAWRAWHHYRAFKASEYLESLAKEGAITPEPSVGLDKIYETYGPDSEPPKDPSPTTGPEDEKEQERLILSREAVPKIVNLFDLPSTAAADMQRAIDQTSVRLKKAREL